MRIIEADFKAAATPEIKSALTALIERSTTFDDIFEEWFLKEGNRFGLSLALDDDGKVMPEVLSVYFDTAKGKEVLSATVSRSAIIEAYPEVEPFNKFIKGWSARNGELELYEHNYDSWLTTLGFTQSYALMTRTGSRTGAIHLMLSFALSGGGIAEAQHVDPNDPAYEDYDVDLAEEGIDLKDYFRVRPVYLQHPGREDTMRTFFDPLYCRKTT